MTKILITGENSYIGTMFINYLEKNYAEQYVIDVISVRGESWKTLDFSMYDVIFHVAGIAHIKETKANKDLYFKVNKDLVIDVAKKAKKEKVQQFIFLSSMSVFGIEEGMITQNTVENPISAYGQSKFEGEKELKKLKDSDFNIAILRPPMVYGKHCKGNYQKLSFLAKKTPIFPDYPNMRSMIFIDNLTLFVKELIDEKSSGLFHPQNNEYINTSSLVSLIAKENGKKVYMTKWFNIVLKFLSKKPVFNKVFGSLTYEKESNKDYMLSYQETIKLTEN